MTFTMAIQPMQCIAVVNYMYIMHHHSHTHARTHTHTHTHTNLSTKSLHMLMLDTLSQMLLSPISLPFTMYLPETCLCSARPARAGIAKFFWCPACVL